MPDEKSLGSKILGLFVEPQGEAASDAAPEAPPGEKTAAELVAELASQSAPKRAGEVKPSGPRPGPTAGPPPSPSGPLPQVAPAAVDFDAVFKAAGVDPAELDRVRKAEELLKGLPEAGSKEVRRQIVEASLRVFGFDVQKIAQAAHSQLKALDTWGRLTDQQTQKAIADAQGQIRQLEDKVISLRADINKRTDQAAGMAAAAEARRAEVMKVLEFFQTAPGPTGPAKP